MNKVLTVVLSHQPPQELCRVWKIWECVAGDGNLVLAYGGPPERFKGIAWPEKLFVDDARLRTRDHQREKQSYTAIWQHVSGWLKARRAKFEFVRVVEYDHLPLVNDLDQRMISFVAAQNADVLAFQLQRIDATNHPHYLYHASDRRFHEFFTNFSGRCRDSTILSMLGTGSFWRREAFEAVAARAEPFPIYLEVYLPTLVHHLGFRIRGMGEQDRFVTNERKPGDDLGSAVAAGAWTFHPVKRSEDLKTIEQILA